MLLSYKVNLTNSFQWQGYFVVKELKTIYSGIVCWNSLQRWKNFFFMNLEKFPNLTYLQGLHWNTVILNLKAGTF